VLLSVSQLLLHSVVAAFRAAAAETPQLRHSVCFTPPSFEQEGYFSSTRKKLNTEKNDRQLAEIRLSNLEPQIESQKNNESNRIPIFHVESLPKIVEPFPKNAQIAI